MHAPCPQFHVHDNKHSARTAQVLGRLAARPIGLHATMFRFIAISDSRTPQDLMKFSRLVIKEKSYDHRPDARLG